MAFWSGFDRVDPTHIYTRLLKVRNTYNLTISNFVTGEQPVSSELFIIIFKSSVANKKRKGERISPYLNPIQTKIRPLDSCLLGPSKTNILLLNKHLKCKSSKMK